jgi:molybdate transport system substrate-binding protein
MNNAAAIIVYMLVGLASPTARAGEVRVLSPSAMHASLEQLADAHGKASGDRVKLSFETAPAIVKRLIAGELADVLIAPPAAMAELMKLRKASADGQFELGRVGVGIVVRGDAPTPDVSSTEAVTRAILQAESLVYNRASSGVYVEQLMSRLGIADEVKAKTTRYHDAEGAFNHLAKGKGREVGFGGLTEIARWRDKGLRLVGPLPPDIQNYTVYVAALATESPNPDGARALLRFLSSPAAKAILSGNGVQ